MYHHFAAYASRQKTDHNSHNDENIKFHILHAVREVCPSLECHICVCFIASHGRSGKVHTDSCTCTVHELSCAIARQLHVPVEALSLHWSCGSRILDSAVPRFTLVRAGFPTSGRIQLNVHVNAPKSAKYKSARAVQIFVKYKKSHTISIVPSVDTVHTLQSKIWNKVGLPVARQWLQCCKPLPYNDSTPLCEYGIVGGMTIFLNLRPADCSSKMCVESLGPRVSLAEARNTKRRWHTRVSEDTSDMVVAKRLRGCNISKPSKIKTPMTAQLIGQSLVPTSPETRPMKRPYRHLDSASKLHIHSSALSNDCTPHTKRFKREIFYWWIPTAVPKCLIRIWLKNDLYTRICLK